VQEYLDSPLYSKAYDDAVANGQKRQLVYLSSDADEVLESLDPHCAYIIGGIVDRNRYKGITHQKALAQGLRVAKLPIKEHFAMSATHILTVNHVFEILLNFRSTGDWKASLEAVLPKRKNARAAGEEGDDEEGDDEEGDEEGEGGDDDANDDHDDSDGDGDGDDDDDDDAASGEGADDAAAPAPQPDVPPEKPGVKP